MLNHEETNLKKQDKTCLPQAEQTSVRNGTVVCANNLTSGEKCIICLEMCFDGVIPPSVSGTLRFHMLQPFLKS